MLKYFFLSFLLYSCSSSSQVNDTPISENMSVNTLLSADLEARIKSIKYSSYHIYKKELVPYSERTLTYSPDNQRVEYVEIVKGDEVFEKSIAEYKEDKLMSIITDFNGSTYKHNYEYNSFGDLSLYRSSNDDYTNEEVYSYDNRKLINRSSYDCKDAKNKKLISEEKFIYDSLGKSMDRVYSYESETKTTKYTFNAKGQITSKSEPYKKYKVKYEGDSLINIELVEDIEPYATTTTITLKYGSNGLLSERVKTMKRSKEFTYLTYDENDNLSKTLFITELQDGKREYVKCEFGPYTVKSKMIFPSWNVNAGLFYRQAYDGGVDKYLDEKPLYNGVQNVQNPNFKSIPDYYVMYNSKDSINWTPELRFDYVFENVKK